MSIFNLQHIFLNLIYKYGIVTFFHHFSKSVHFNISTMDMLNCARFDER